ncbi:hypothetical protein BO94DRAFT_94514 [Aspergillus sclerotioniger CBS 115572]|uniref:Uncharacterized protein n=1 Tax=Aspergillus sclerotioniger CBS 115572 TaxID=1450535 RepID=A0A317WI60_9EURO|nr:hypothetical protein BO94DRAFT_94514 [Aspergillus sclerotioniger CBS 115572]PWY85725.1 hypothetical protein BO94DRAFT_94514 [Aspergillus sclerotioniger CBS 115572]
MTAAAHERSRDHWPDHWDHYRYIHSRGALCRDCNDCGCWKRGGGGASWGCDSGEIRDYQEGTRIDGLISEHCHRSGSVGEDPSLSANADKFSEAPAQCRRLVAVFGGSPRVRLSESPRQPSLSTIVGHREPKSLVWMPRRSRLRKTVSSSVLLRAYCLGGG